VFQLSCLSLTVITRFMACKIFSLRYFMYGNLMYIISFFLLCMNTIGIIIHISSSRSFFIPSCHKSIYRVSEDNFRGSPCESEWVLISVKDGELVFHNLRLHKDNKQQ
jgi:hypothetical protein